MNPFRGRGSLYVSEKQHGSFVHIVHLRRPSVDSLIEFPCCQEFFCSFVVSVVDERRVAYKSVPWWSSLRITLYGSSWESATSTSRISSSWESPAASSSGRAASWGSEHGVSWWRETQWWAEIESSADPWVRRGIWLIWSGRSNSGCVVCGEHSARVWIYSPDLDYGCFCDYCGTHLLCQLSYWWSYRSWTRGK